MNLRSRFPVPSLKETDGGGKMSDGNWVPFTL